MTNQKCSSCGATIFFVKNAKTGNFMCLNSEPDPKGNVVLQDGLAHVVGKGGLFEEGAVRFLSHHATCPNVAQHRRKK